MDKLKKIWKELSVFGIVFITILGLFAYRRISHVDYKTISEKKFISMVENQESFVVFTGSSSCTDCSVYGSVVEKYLKDNRGKTIYYINLDKVSDTFINDFLNGEAELTTAHTFKIENGIIVDSGTNITYYVLDRMMRG